MSENWQGEKPEPQWNQPPFSPGYGEPEPTGFRPAPRPSFGEAGLPDAVSGSVVVPAGAPVPPPGLLESTIRVLTGLIWPLAILLAVFRGGWGFFIAAFVASAVLGNLARELKRRRVAKAHYRPQLPPSQDLR